MNTFFNYAIEANVGILVFLLLYRLLLRDETNFRLRRGYLIGSLIVSLIFPLLTFQSSQEVIPSLNFDAAAYLLPELHAGPAMRAPTPIDEPGINFSAVLIYGYLTVVIILILKFGLELYQILGMILRRSNQHVIEIDSNITAFSFLNYIFIGKNDALSPSEVERIIKHEQVHIRLHHSFDILLIRLVRILFWFNPILVIYNREMHTVHEFQADEETVINDNIQTYCNLLTRVTLMSAGFRVVNHFNNSLTIKRITMLNTMKKRFNSWKLTIVLPVAAAFFFVVACQDQVMDDIKEVSESGSMATEIVLPPNVQNRLANLQYEKPDANFVVLRFDESEQDKLKELKVRAASMAYIELIKDEDQDAKEIYVIMSKDESTRQLGELTKSEEDVFMIVEDPAKPMAGMEEYYMQVGSLLRYPAEARKNGVEGRVFVQFVVNEDGSISNVETIKGIGSGCDEEAVRVVKEVPMQWIPGKQRGKTVRQKMVLPVVFSLGSTSTITKTSGLVSNEDAMEIQYQMWGDENGKVLVGKVSGNDGKPLAGVNIYVAGKTYGTVSDKDGSFKLKLQETSGKIILSHLSYSTFTINF